MQNAKNVLQGTTSCDAVAKCSRHLSWIHVEHLPIMQTTKPMETPNHLSIIHLRLKQWWSSSQQASHLHTSPPNTMFFAHSKLKNRQRNPGAFVERCLKLVPVFPFSASRTPRCRCDDFLPWATLFSLQKRMYNSAQRWNHQLYTIIV